MDKTEAVEEGATDATTDRFTTEAITEVATDSVTDGEINHVDGGGDEFEEAEHPTIIWPNKNQNLQIKRLNREFEKILSGFRGKLDDNFIDRWTGQNGGIGKWKKNADRIMRSITSNDRECIDLDTKIPNPFKQAWLVNIYTAGHF